MQNDHSSEHDIDEAIMRRFWTHGYAATSIQDLIDAAGSNRAAIYGKFGGKKRLFLASLALYQEAVVTPAFAPVEADGAGLASIAAFFEMQIAAAVAAGLPGPGCLIANSMTELGAHDADVQAVVNTYLLRLRAGFARALSNEFSAPAPRVREQGQFLAVGALGLWSFSRSVTDAKPLRSHARLLIQSAKGALS
jgi:TetR/AcrR family transcriptional regulator, transcriptional repressor for nem operon